MARPPVSAAKVTILTMTRPGTAAHLLTAFTSIGRRAEAVGVALGVALFYAVGGALGLMVPLGEHSASLIWPASGIAFAAVWRFGAPALVGVAVGALLVAGLRTGAAGFGLVAALGNTLSVLVAVRLLRHKPVADLFRDPAAVLRFALVAAVGGPLFSATLGTLALLGYEAIRPADALGAWLLWWASDAMGVLIVAPPLLTLPRWRLRRWPPARLAELALLAAAIGLLWWGLLVAPVGAALPQLSFAAAPLLIWAALRFEFPVVCTAVMLLAAMAVLATVTGRGPFVRADMHESFFYLHGYLATLACFALTLGVAISAQRRSIRRLQSSEERFRGLADASPMLIWLADGEGRCIYFNRSWLDYTGCSLAEEIGYGWHARVHPEDLPSLLTAFDAALACGSDYRAEFRLRRADGVYRWFLDSGKPRLDDHGRCIGLVGSSVDISERKRAELHLQGQARILRELTIDTPLPALLTDLAGFVEALVPETCCAVLLADAGAGTLHLAAAPRLPELHRQWLQVVPIDDATSLSGAAAARRELTIAVDEPDDALWLRFRGQMPPWLRAYWASPFFSSDGELLGIVSLYGQCPRRPLPDELELIHVATSLAGIVVQRSRGAALLRESEERFRVTFEQAAVGFALIGLDGRCLKANRKFCGIIGCKPAEVATLRLQDITTADDLAVDLKLMERALAGEIDDYTMEKRFRRQPGRTVWVNQAVALVRDAAREPLYFITVVEDIGERKRAEAEVERLALYDPLTGLPNRRLFLDRLQHALSLSRRTGQFGALLFVDLDNFKHLNDARGHVSGDELLRQVALLLKRSLREQDTVGRHGGDEFVVLLEGLGRGEAGATSAAGALAEKLRRGLETAFELDGYLHHVSASIGVTLFPKHDESVEDLLKEADTAMYRAKARSRNAVCFYAPEMQAAAELRLSLERDLRSALRRNEFSLYLQPQVDAERRIVGAEALLRWQHPERGAITPATFIPVAEECGLIVPLGEWVLVEACRLIRAIDAVGERCPIAVNVSPRQFREPHFAERVKAILRDSGVDPQQLVLEITEGVVVADIGDTIAKMTELQQLGLRFSIDDFGTGYSSLAYLKRLPLHELKIDRTFVSDLPQDANDVALVETILAVARHLQLNVVAEGVESEAQFEFLRQRGCPRFQGYHCGRPRPAADYFPALAAP